MTESDRIAALTELCHERRIETCVWRGRYEAAEADVQALRRFIERVKADEFGLLGDLINEANKVLNSLDTPGQEHEAGESGT